MSDHSRIFEGRTFEAPEGTLTAQIKSETADGEQLEILLWFYDEAGKPIHENLTLVLSGQALANGQSYPGEVVARVQQWLSGVRTGEPLEVMPMA